MAAVITAGLTGIAGTASGSVVGGTGTAGSPAPVTGSPGPLGPSKKAAGMIGTLSPHPGSKTPVQNTPTRIDEIGQKTYPDIYGGLAETQQGTNIVYLTRPDPGAEHQLAAEAPAGTIAFVYTPHSLKFLDSIHQKVINQFSALKAAGIQLIEWAPEIAAGREMIGVEDLTPAKTRILGNRFGASNLELRNMPANAFTLTQSDRAYDIAPWNSGDFITNNVSGCSSGFGVLINGYAGNITADHCFSYKDSIYNYDYDCPCGSNTYMGYISQNDNAQNGVDAEVLFTTNGGSSQLMYLGTPSTGNAVSVSGWTTNPVGGYVCNSGAYSGTVCGMQIINNNTCLYLADLGRQVCHLIHAYSPGGAIANETGDSGGPIFRDSSPYYAAGIDVASTTADTTPCQYNTQESCFTDIFYDAMDSVLSAFNATIITG
jgi:hypothetical protein